MSDRHYPSLGHSGQKTGCRKSHLILLLLVCFLGYYAKASIQLDSLKQYVDSTIPDTSKLESLKELSVALCTTDPDLAMKYGNTGLKIAVKYGRKKAEADFCHSLGSIFESKGEYQKAMDQLFRSLKLYEDVGDKPGIASAYNMIGIIFRLQENYSKAIDFQEKAMRIYEELGDKDGVAQSLVNTGNNYYNQRQYDNTIGQYEKALNIYQELGNKESIAVIENNIGAVYFEKGDYKTANEYFIKSYLIREESGNKYEMATSLNNIGEVYAKQGDYKKAIENCTKSLYIASEIDAKDIMQYNYENLAGVFAVTGEYEKAFNYQKLAYGIKDSILSIENNKQINELSVKYETEKKEAEIKLLNKDKERQQLVIYSFLGGLSLVCALAFFIFWGYRVKKRANVELQIKQKEIVAANSELEVANVMIREKNKDITDSIRYAKRLQSAILKPEDNIGSYFAESFIVFKPKDIVSGDFYWFEKFGNLSLVAAADCTGHGVPGAFMSIIGCNLLSQAVNEYAITQPAAILNSLNKGLSKVLQQKQDAVSVQDGMDITLCVFDPEKMVIQYAGAYNPLWLVRDGQLIEYKADKFPVGAFVGGETKMFTNHEISVRKGDVLYLFSDGYADQFGGPHGKKFKYKQFQKILIDNYSQPMKIQKNMLEQAFAGWIGNLAQVDDVLLIGIRI